MVEYIDYRLALIEPESRQLLGIDVAGIPEFPWLSIPRWERPAEQLTRLVEKRWGIKTILIEVLRNDLDVPCAVLEMRTFNSRLADSCIIPIFTEDLRSTVLDEFGRHRLRAILSGDHDDCSPFSRLGWVDEARRWISSIVGTDVAEFTDDIRQLNCSGRFTLVRFPTRYGQAFWLKAVGAPNAHEFRVTRTLSEYFPDYLPTFIAARQDWNAWVTKDAGRQLDEESAFDTERAIDRMAELQIASLPHIDALLASGCWDQRIGQLRSRIPELVEYLQEAMAQQTSTKVSRLEADRVRKVGEAMERACDSLEATAVPDTLIHNDQNTGNILLDNTHCVFIDWAEGAVGNPFLAFQQFRVHITRAGALDRWRPEFDEIYWRHWRGLLSKSQVESMLVLAPLLTVTCYLYGRGTWLTDSRRLDPEFQRHARTLTRHMDRAIQAPQLRDALCL